MAGSRRLSAPAPAPIRCGGAPTAAAPSGPPLALPPAAGQGAVAQGAAGATALGSASPTQDAASFRAKESSWRTIPGRASQSAEATKAYAAVQSFIARYPTEQSLKDAAFTSDQGGNHYNVSKSGIYDDGTTHMAHVIVENGRVTGAQFDSNARNLADPPPAWAGVQWHWHDHGKSSWMAHVDVTKPLDQAFIEQTGH